MNIPVYHHYLPQLYLRAFCRPEKQKEIWRHDRGGETSSVEIGQTGGQEHLYAHGPVSTATNVHVETKFNKKWEDRAAPVIKKLIAGEPISEKDRKNLSTFLALQELRTPETRELFDVTVKVMIRETAERCTSDELGQLLEGEWRIPGVSPDEARQWRQEIVSTSELPEDFLKRTWLSRLKSAVNLSRSTFENVQWAIFDATNAGASFVTSDSPIVSTAPRDDIIRALPLRFMHGPAVISFYALSPRHLLFFGNSPYSGISPERANVDSRSVRIFSEYIVCSAKTSVYSHSCADAEWIHKLLLEPRRVVSAQDIRDRQSAVRLGT